MTLYYLKYNNYYNRIVKQESDIEAYKNYLITDESNNVVPSATVENVAFDFGDGVNTTHILKNWPYAIPDYLVITDDYGINSRWFIIDAKSTRKYGQYEISLRRDLMVDFYESFINSPAYIERGIINRTNKLIYNSENMQFNQIKTSEILLKDITNTPWIVAYIARNTEAKEISGNAYSKLEDAYYDFEYSYNSLVNMGKIYGNLVGDAWGDIIVNIYQTGGSVVYKGTALHSNGYTNPSYGNIEGNNIYISGSQYTIPNYIKESSAIFKEYWDENVSTINNLFPSEVDFVTKQGKINQLLEMNNKIIKDTTTGILFTINVKTSVETVGKKINANGSLYNNISNVVKTMPGITVNSTNNNQSIIVNGKFNTATVEVKTIPGKNINVKIPSSSDRINLIDQPWDMLAIPYNSDISIIKDITYKTDENIALSIAQEISLDAGMTVYDIQLLPYCPCWNYIDINGNINLIEFKENLHYSWINDSDGNHLSVILWCSLSSFNPVIPFNNIALPSDNIEFKIANECDKYRLVSPNYSGIFEFSATKNGGITGFEANCTYKPYKPYIHINPVFSELYGTDFNDNRGLICGGNFSIPTTQDAWVNYQIQNKSYEEAHQRQITNMEDVYKLQIQQQKISSVLGGISGVISGAGTGAMIGAAGGPLGALAGGMIGAGTSLIANTLGAAADLEFAQRAQDLALSYTKDQWDLSLQNIKALPYTISNVGAFDINYKYFPFLEYYTCTDEEKEALRNKIKYNGMTINVIDNINKYVYNDGSYISAQLIRITDLDEDYHVAAEIASELHKGIYI